MTLSDAVTRIDGLQRSKRFKIVMTVVTVVLAIASISAWLIIENAPSASQAAPVGSAEEDSAETTTTFDVVIIPFEVGLTVGTVLVGVGAVMVFSIGAAWLGIWFTCAGLLLGAGLIAGPLYAIPPTKGLGQLLFGAFTLLLSFSVLLRIAQLVLDRGRPIPAIARTVLAEAVRMKISLVFIVLLVFLLAGMPMLLNPDSLLRYRVQSFLQYAVSGSFWVLAMLTLFFSIGTVAFEQRDRIIWQTMSKPVSAAQYLIGKWLGVVTLNLLLLTVTATGVFLFTYSLRNQTAVGESVPFVNANGSSIPTEDRVILETQILTARTGAKAEIEIPTAEDVEPQVARRIEELIAREPTKRNDQAALNRFAAQFQADEMNKAYEQARAIPPGGVKRFRFPGLHKAKAHAQAELDRGVEPEQVTPVVFRFKAHSGADNPSMLYRLTFLVESYSKVNETPLDVAQTIAIRPVNRGPEGSLVWLIDSDGVMTMTVINGDYFQDRPNPVTVRFAKSTFEVLYPAGSFAGNYTRVMALMWIKLSFIAAIGIASSTFLSYPIACMATMLMLFASETGGFLAESLDYFPIYEGEDFKIVNLVIQVIASPIARAFEPYAALKPTTQLIDGRLIPLDGLALALSLIVLSGMLFMTIGWSIFRKRELATYSGH